MEAEQAKGVRLIELTDELIEEIRREMAENDTRIAEIGTNEIKQRPKRKRTE